MGLGIAKRAPTAPETLRAETERIRQALADDAVGVVSALLGGGPCERRPGEARWAGRALSLRLSGPRRGSWRDHKSGEGGGLLDLIAREREVDFAGAIGWARDFLGGDLRENPIRRQRREEEDRAALAAEAAKADRLAKILAGLAPIEGTPAEAYLTARGIASERWPEAVKWSVSERAIVFIGNGGKAAQRVLLDDAGRPLLGDDGRKRKLSLGPLEGGAVKFPGPADAPLVLAEGPETGLAVWTATGLETWSALGIVSTRLDLSMVPIERLVIVAADDDAELPLAPSMKALRHAVATWSREGRRVAQAFPWETRRHDKSDYADLIAEGGPEAVRARLAPLLAPDPPPPPHRGLPVVEARQRLAEMIEGTIGRLVGTGWSRERVEPSPAALIVAPLGLGKSEAALRQALRRIGEGLGPIVFATPTHALNQELRDRARALAGEMGIAARVEMRLGRDAVDPEAGDGRAMCLDLEAVREIEAAGLPAEEHACAKGEIKCALFNQCGFQRQRKRSADLWLVSHAALSHAKPREIPEPALVIVDENPISALLRGTEGFGLTLGDADLAPVPAHLDTERAWAWEADRRELVTMRRTLRDLADQVQKSLCREDLENAGIAAETARSAAGQVKNLIIAPKGLVPGLAQSERRRVLVSASENRARLREARLYREIAEFLDRADKAPATPRISRVIVRGEGGAASPAWRLATLGAIAKGWRAPTLLLDATARSDGREILRQAFPGLRGDLGGTIEAMAPHARVSAIPGRKVSKAALNGSPKLAREILTFAAMRAIGSGRPGRALLVGNKALGEKLEADEITSPRVELAHFNAVRGRDTWKNAPVVVVAGRPLPSPEAVEFIAGVILGRTVETTIPAGGWYGREAVPVTIGGRISGTIERERHPDAMAEAVRWQICEAEILQAIGRIRAVNRTPENPAEIVLIGCPIPEGLTLDEIEAFDPPGPFETMLAVSGVAVDSPTAAAKAFPKLWAKPETVRTALHRRGRPLHSLIEGPHKGLSRSALDAYTAQMKGQRQHPFLALADSFSCPCPREFLTALLGPLARCDLTSGEIDPAPPLAPTLEEPAKIAGAFEEPPGRKVEMPPYTPPARAEPPGRLPVPPGDLRQALRRSGLTIDAFSRHAGISRPHLSNALAGRFNMSEEAAVRIEIALASLPPPPPDLFAGRH